MPHHSNGLCLSAIDSNNQTIFSKVYYSVGGGFVVDEDSFNGNMSAVNTINSDKAAKQVPYPFNTAKGLLEHCEANKKTIAEVVFSNELVYRTEQEIKQGVLEIWHVMDQCIENGTNTSGVLPGGLNIKRRAPDLYKKSIQNDKQPKTKRGTFGPHDRDHAPGEDRHTYHKLADYNHLREPRESHATMEVTDPRGGAN